MKVFQWLVNTFAILVLDTVLREGADMEVVALLNKTFRQSSLDIDLPQSFIVEVVEGFNEVPP